MPEKLTHREKRKRCCIKSQKSFTVCGLFTALHNGPSVPGVAISCGSIISIFKLQRHIIIFLMPRANKTAFVFMGFAIRASSDHLRRHAADVRSALWNTSHSSQWTVNSENPSQGHSGWMNHTKPAKNISPKNQRQNFLGVQATRTCFCQIGLTALSWPDTMR